MEAIASLILGLILVNGLLMVVVGLVLLDNPFKIEILAAVVLANVLVFFLTALFTSESPAAALLGFGTKLVPLVVLAIGFAALLLIQAKLRPSK